MMETQVAKLSITTEIVGDQAVAKIVDNGSGMKPETKKRMFEAFHTTKPKGTGLGLAVTLKILQAHQAQIFVESEVGLGTQFVISFPLKKS
jgi:two-component system, NtrC family, sensor histidine kinase PilS